MALMPVDEALRRILDGVKPLPTETIPLGKALGRVLAKDVVAKRDQPPFPASAMDGYAVRHEDVVIRPATLKLIGASNAGHAFKGGVKPGTAVRILTGAPVPKGADTVVIQENTERDGNILRVLTETPKGKNIRRAGLDFTKGNVLVKAGTKLVARDIGLLAAANAPRITVRRAPRVVLFTTGDELVLPGQTARPDQIYSSNSHALEAMAQTLGCEVINLGIVRDSLAATKAAVRKGLGADVLLTTGGASVGDHDYVQEAFKACGVKIGFWKVALRPGKPFMYGRKGKTHVMGLPGNPVSALVTARIFLAPLVKAFQGLPAIEHFITARLVGALPANDERRDYIRAILTDAADGMREVEAFSMQDSSMQRTLQSSQVLILREPFAPPADKGSLVKALLLDF
jgi:molybdopterin molybdotransferase